MILHTTVAITLLCGAAVTAMSDPRGRPNNVCPELDCPRSDAILDECRQPQYMLGPDGVTQCRLCDVNICEDENAIIEIAKCPAFDCPGDAEIPDECRKQEFVIGTDGFTACRVCDTNLCDPSKCPQVVCPAVFIPKKCRKLNYSIAPDRISRCPLCDTNICGSKEVVCPRRGRCPRIPDECRVKQRMIGTDGITICRMCDINMCDGTVNQILPAL